MMNRDALVEKLKSSLDEMNAEIDRIEKETKELGNERREAVEARVDDLKRKRSEVTDEIDKIREAGADSWQALRTGAENALAELVSGITKAKEHFEPAVVRK